MKGKIKKFIQYWILELFDIISLSVVLCTSFIGTIYLAKDHDGLFYLGLLSLIYLITKLTLLAIRKDTKHETKNN